MLVALSVDFFSLSPTFMSSPPQLSAEIEQILARRTRMRRILISLVVLLLVASFGMTAWVIWQRNRAPELAPRPDAVEPATDVASTAGQVTVLSPVNDPGTGVKQGSGDASVGSLFDLQPGVGVDQDPASQPVTGGGEDEPVLRIDEGLEHITSRRAMEEFDVETFDARSKAIVVGAMLNEILGASSPDEVVPHLRHGESMRPLLEAFAERAEAHRLPSRVEVRGATLVEVDDLPVFLLQLAHPLFKEAAFMRDSEAEKWLLDWESFVGFSLLGWDDLRQQKPQTPTYVRAHALLADYYNFEFSDQERYLALRLDSPDNYHAIYGYVDREHPQAAEIMQALARQRVRPALVVIRYPDSATQNNQVIIDEVVAWRWLDVRDGPTNQFSNIEGNARPTPEEAGEDEAHGDEAGAAGDAES